jgi:hypothetical protein
MVERQRLQQHAADDAEDRGIRANAEREGQDGYEREESGVRTRRRITREILAGRKYMEPSGTQTYTLGRAAAFGSKAAAVCIPLSR